MDQDGNLAINAWFNAPTRELSVVSRFTVEMLRENPFDYVLTGPSLNLPMWYVEPLCTALTPYRNDTHVAESVKQYAKSAAAGAEWNALSFLLALTRQIFQTFRQVIRPNGPPWPSDRTLNSMEGSCRDLAVLFCDACRVMGIAARFVSGYECASANNRESYMHAWAEVYLPVVGWRGYDPSRGLAVSNRHVAVAAGFDYDLASPVAGWYSGGSRSQMEASLSLQVDEGDENISGGSTNGASNNSSRSSRSAEPAKQVRDEQNQYDRPESYAETSAGTPASMAVIASPTSEK
jgi:transglutaminase-like putative cysteine protease